MKDCLVSADAKFSPCAGVDGLNVLFLCCGFFYRMNEWYHCLYGGEGLFGREPFHPPQTFSKVDVVVLSNLKYRHEHARDFPAWTLDDVFLLPLVNPHRRFDSTSDAIEEGLSVFNHYLKEFAVFQGGHLIVDEHSETRALIEEMLKVNRFVAECLTPEQRSRFFPILLNQ